MHLLLTRPAHDAQEDARRLKAEGYDVTLSPVAKVELIKDIPLSQNYAASLFTSSNAARAIASLLKHASDLLEKPCYCVGQKTALAAKEAGFTSIIEGPGTVDTLLNLIAQEDGHDGENWVYFSADVIRHDPRPTLKNLGITVDRQIVYKTHPIPELSQDGKDALQKGAIDYVLFYSPRAVDLFQDQLKKAGLDDSPSKLNALCLSADVAARAKDIGFQNVHSTKDPSKAAIYDALKALNIKDQGDERVEQKAEQHPSQTKHNLWRAVPWGLSALLIAFIAGVFTTPAIAPHLAPYIPWFQAEKANTPDYEPRFTRIREDIDALKNAPKAESAPSVDYGPQIEAIEDRLETLTQAAPDDAQINALETKLYTLETQVERLSNTGPNPLLSARLDALEDRMDQLRIDANTDLRPAFATLAFAALKDQIVAGNPFEDSLGTLDHYVVDEDGQAALHTLRPYAQDGIVHENTLKAQFSRFATVLLQKAKTPENAGWWEKTLSRAQGLITVRKTGDVAGDTPEAIISRIENFAQQGRWAKVLETVSTLPPHVQESAPLKPWLEDVRAYRAAAQALTTLQSSLNGQG